MVDETLESALFPLLEEHGLEDILFAFYRYADTQARLAEFLQQAEAADSWRHQAIAIDLACEALDEVNRVGCRSAASF
ncbi:MAG: hypothetical protein AAFY57_01260 [Cyanobacteria bacterium J06642_2]